MRVLAVYCRRASVGLLFCLLAPFRLFRRDVRRGSYWRTKPQTSGPYDAR
jgi:hypothetical protein